MREYSYIEEAGPIRRRGKKSLTLNIGWFYGDEFDRLADEYAAGEEAGRED